MSGNADKGEWGYGVSGVEGLGNENSEGLGLVIAKSEGVSWVQNQLHRVRHQCEQNETSESSVSHFITPARSIVMAQSTKSVSKSNQLIIGRLNSYCSLHLLLQLIWSSIKKSNWTIIRQYSTPIIS